jgi:hypothetical protein
MQGDHLTDHIQDGFAVVQPSFVAYTSINRSHVGMFDQTTQLAYLFVESR